MHFVLSLEFESLLGYNCYCIKHHQRAVSSSKLPGDFNSLGWTHTPILRPPSLHPSHSQRDACHTLNVKNVCPHSINLARFGWIAESWDYPLILKLKVGSLNFCHCFKIFSFLFYLFFLNKNLEGLLFGEATSK